MPKPFPLVFISQLAVSRFRPTTSVLPEQHLAAVARGDGGLDRAALAKLAADMAGEG